jgi:hypothetical protein
MLDSIILWGCELVAGAIAVVLLAILIGAALH